MMQQQPPAGNPAEMYESFFVPAMFAPLATLVLERVSPRPGERVLDVACGTGIVARRAARLVGDGGRLVGVDPSPAMLTVARSTAVSEGVSVEWQEGMAEALPFPDGSFDLALCQMGLQFFPDKQAGLGEMRRVLVPGGRAAVSVWQEPRHQLFAAINDAMLRRLGVPALDLPFSLGDAGTVRSLLSSAEFAAVEVEPISITARFSDPQRFVPLQVAASAAAVPALQQLDPQSRNDLADAIKNELEPMVREHTVGAYLELQMHGLVAQGRRP